MARRPSIARVGRRRDLTFALPGHLPQDTCPPPEKNYHRLFVGVIV